MGNIMSNKKLEIKNYLVKQALEYYRYIILCLLFFGITSLFLWSISKDKMFLMPGIVCLVFSFILKNIKGIILLTRKLIKNNNSLPNLLSTDKDGTTDD